MANDIRINIEVQKEREAARKLDQVGDAAERAGDSIEELGEQSTAASKATEKAGDKFREGADDLGFLNKQIIDTRDHLKDLIRELDRTGDTSLLKDIAKEGRNLRKFESLAKQIAEPVAEAGVAAGAGLAKSLAEGFRTASGAAKGAIVPAVVGVAALATPGIANIVAAAVVGGVGVGGIIGGVALAAQDPRVQAAGGALGEQLASEFQDAAGGFVEPVLRSINKVASAGLADKLAPSFDKLAKSVDPLTDGLLGLVDNALPGLESAVNAAGPVLDVLAQGLPEIGDAIGDFFQSISDDPETLANGLELFISAVSDAIRFTGDLIETFIGIYGVAYDVADALGLITEREEDTSKATEDTGNKLKILSKHAKTAEEQIRDFSDAISEVFGRTLSVREATLNYQKAIDDLAEGAKGANKTLDEGTEAGRENWELILNATRAIEENREARVRQKMGIQESNEKYVEELESLRKQLIALGYNKEAVNKYIAELKKVPQQAITEVHVKGIKQALADIKELGRAIGAVTGYAILSVASNLGHRASGGPVMAGGNYIVGENGPELLTMNSGGGGYVYNAGQTASMVAAGGGGMSVQVVLSAAPGPLQQFVEFMLPHIQVAIAGQGGVVQDVLGTPQR